MAAELQDLVDRLGRELRRSVAVDDPELRIIVYGDHYGDEDGARLQALVERGATRGMREYLAGHRITTWHEPRYMDAESSLGLKRRLAVPLWSGTTLVGFMWIIVSGDLDPGEFEAVLDTAGRVTALLARRAGQQADDERRRAGLVRDVVSAVPATRAESVGLLGQEHPFVGALSYSAVLVALLPPTGPRAPEIEIIVREAVRKALAARPRDGYAMASIDAGTVVLLGSRAPLGPDEAAKLGRRIHREIQASGDSVPTGLVVGVGGPTSGLDGVHASLGQARVSVRAAASAGQGAVAWADLGPAALLPALVERSLEPQLLPVGLESLMAAQDAATLRLVEAYLEAAGSAADTAARLHMHRSSVYYHLGQFQKATGWDLGDGDARFHLHLWFKYRKLASVPEVGGPCWSGGASR